MESFSHLARGLFWPNFENRMNGRICVCGVWVRGHDEPSFGHGQRVGSGLSPVAKRHVPRLTDGCVNQTADLLAFGQSRANQFRMSPKQPFRRVRPKDVRIDVRRITGL